MTWYVLTDKKTGEHYSTGSVISPEAYDKYDVVEFEQEEDPSKGKVWDSDAAEFVVDSSTKGFLDNKVLNDPRLDSLTKQQKDLLAEVLVEKF